MDDSVGTGADVLHEGTVGDGTLVDFHVLIGLGRRKVLNVDKPKGSAVAGESGPEHASDFAGGSRQHDGLSIHIDS
jgi:hypothetical protein